MGRQGWRSATSAADRAQARPSRRRAGGTERLLYCDHVAREGEELFRLAVEHDLEGIVAKHKHSPYGQEQKTTWFKIRNRDYSQWVGREELFERERHQEAVVAGWESCGRAAYTHSERVV